MYLYIMFGSIIKNIYRGPHKMTDMIRVSPEFRKKLKRLKFEMEQECNRRISEEEFTSKLDISLQETNDFKQKKRGRQWYY
jgi:mRNA-degrading endonuclease RelE of RelBE toxin-antitoxin system